MKITAIQKLKVLGFTALLGLGLIACGGGSGLPDIPDVGSSTTSSSSGGTIRVTNSTSADIGYVYVRTSGTTSWGSDLTNGTGFSGSASGYKIAPGETGVITGVSCGRTIDLRAQDYSSNEAIRSNYYFSCSTTLAWTITSTGAGSSTSSSSTSSSSTSSSSTSSSSTSSSGGTSVTIYSSVGTKGNISAYFDGSYKGLFTSYYSSGAPTCGSTNNTSAVSVSTTGGSHSVRATSNTGYNWATDTFNVNTGTCVLYKLY